MMHLGQFMVPQEVKEHALKLLQCRSLLLTHAFNCTEPGGECQLSPLCDSIKRLLVHMKSCRNRSVNRVASIVRTVVRGAS